MAGGAAPTRRRREGAREGRRARRGTAPERLLDAAAELVSEAGYAGASVSALAERAGVATGALYRHWSSKEELFAELFRKLCDREIEAIELALDDAAQATGAQRAQLLISVFARRALRNPRMAWALLAEPVAPLLDAERICYRRRYAELLESILRQAVAAGELPEQDTRLAAAALVGGVGEALLGPLAAFQPGGEAEALIERLGAFVRRAIGA